MNLLIGHEISDDFYRLNAELRLSTQKLAEETLSIDVNLYIPWACSIPLYGNILEPELLKAADCERGGLVTDRHFLAAVRKITEFEANLLKKKSRDDIQEAISGPIDSWMPLADVNEGIRDLFGRGRQHALSSSPSISRRYSELVDYVVPIATPKNGNRGFSSHTSRGVIYRSFPDWATEWDVAIDLTHELGHQCLFVWQSVDPIIASDPEAAVYSLIRHGYRPAQQTFHGAVALAFMLNFVRAYEGIPACQKVATTRGAWYRDNLNDSLGYILETLRRDCQLTDIGQVLYAEMEALVH